MKKITNLYKPYLLRPIVQQMIYRLAAVAAVLLVWQRFGQWNEKAALWGDVSFLAALLLLAGAWFNYLRLDGFLRTPPRREKKPRQTRRTGSMSDDIDTDLVPYAELTDEERTVCRLLAYLIPGTVLLVISLAATIV